MKTVACFGASLTEGTVSSNFVDLLEQRSALRDFRFLNRGVNGDLAWNGLQRLDQVIADRPDYVSILMGTNDVNATMSERNRLRYLHFNRLPLDPTPEWFEENMRAILDRLQKETPAQVSLLSLAVIGEDLEHEANRKVVLYNDIIHRLADDFGATYLPLYERMTHYLAEHAAERASLPPRLEYRDGLVNIGHAIALHASGLSWDEVSRLNGLLVTTDGLHLNRVGAGLVADLVEGWLTRT